MTLAQILFGTVLVLVLLAVAVVAGWKQVVLLRGLTIDLPAPTEEEAHLRGRARRRLVCSVLMAILGLQLAGALLWLEGPAQRLRDLGPLAASEPENREFVRLYGWYWVGFLLLLLTLLMVAGWDLTAVRRHGLRQMRRLQQDRRNMIARQTELLRRQRGREP